MLHCAPIVVVNRNKERYRMNKKFLALALLTVATVNARSETKTWGTADDLEQVRESNEANASMGAVIGAVVAGAHALATGKNKDESLLMMAKGAVCGAGAAVVSKLVGDGGWLEEKPALRRAVFAALGVVGYAIWVKK